MMQNLSFLSCHLSFLSDCAEGRIDGGGGVYVHMVPAFTVNIWACFGLRLIYLPYGYQKSKKIITIVSKNLSLLL